MKLVIQNTARVWGGNEKSLATLAHGLVERGHDVIVSCARGVVSERLKETGIDTTHCRPRGQIDFVSGLSFAVWLKKHAPDSLLMTSWNPIPWAAMSARIAGVKNVVLRQGIVRRAPRSGPHAYALRHWVSDVITNAPEIRDVWLESIPEFPSSRVHVVLNAVASNASRRDQMRARLRSELAVNNETVVISAAGILSRRKNFELLLEAFARLREVDAMIAIVGDGPHREALEAKTSELGLDRCVRFLGARAQGAEVIGGSDVFVLSSNNEGMANVMLEAMAAGVPVIASDISGVRTAIGPHDSRRAAGWIFPPDDASSLANTMSETIALLRTNPGALRVTTDEALWRIDNWFSRDRMLDQSERILFG
jgi:glycosyltransferase involved in cell wall biosynthesis